MRSWYLDNATEPASNAILTELGIKIWDDYSNEGELSGIIKIEGLSIKSSEYVISPEELGPSFGEFVTEMGRENRLNGDLIYRVLQGSMFIDVRDSADEWIRILLARTELILIPPALFRREVLTDQQFIKLESYSSQRSGTEKEFRHEDPRIEHLSHPYTRELVVDLCKEFYHLGWVTGTGGSISVRYGNRIYMTPSGVQKERMEPKDLFVLDCEGRVLSHPGLVPGSNRSYKLSACAPLFMHTYKLRGAGSVLHSHGMECVLATLMCEKMGLKEFRITHQEMIKGLIGYGYHDELVIPIINNTAHEEDLADSLKDAILKYPSANAILVARHGIYVWGPTWVKAKTQSECLHYLFKLAVEMMDLFQMDPRMPPPDWDSYGLVKQDNKRKRDSANGVLVKATAKKTATDSELTKPYKVILLDIEGTTTPISFVHKVMFPYAYDHVSEYLENHWEDEETKANVAALQEQAALDAQEGVPGLVHIPTAGTPEEIRLACVKNVQWQITVDRKTTALKKLQGKIWRFGFHSGLLKGEVFTDVPVAFDRWTEDGLRVAIYSSGSREAQQLLFGHTKAGDLRGYISCYFDTTVGHKRESKSYQDITLSLGVESSEILFVTDIYEEAVAAKAAGLQVAISVRPENSPLPEHCDFLTIRTFDRILPDEAHHPLSHAGLL